MNLQPIIDAPALTLGLVVHKALEQWFEHDNLKLEDLFKANAYYELTKIRDSYLEKVGVAPSDIELADVKQAIIIGMCMTANYEEYYGKPVPEGFKLISSEQRIIVDVPGTVHKLEARIDAVLERIEDGAIFNVDHKTYEKRSSYNDIANNDQFLCYMYAAQKALDTKLAGYMYNGLWKRDRPGKNHVVDDLFHRQLFERPEYELEQFEFQLAAELNEMGEICERNPLEFAAGPELYPFRRWEGCWDCKQFTRLCEAQSKDPIAYELIKMHSYRERDRDDE
jgi:hypothetical protein